MKQDMLSYNEKQALASKIFRIVREYFFEESGVTPTPYVSFSEYDINAYTFGISDSHLGSCSKYWMSEDKAIEMQAFRKQVRKLLKDNGFSKCRFDFRKVKQVTNYWNGAVTDTYKEFVGIYFE